MGRRNKKNVEKNGLTIKSLFLSPSKKLNTKRWHLVLPLINAIINASRKEDPRKYSLVSSILQSPMGPKEAPYMACDAKLRNGIYLICCHQNHELLDIFACNRSTAKHKGKRELLVMIREAAPFLPVDSVMSSGAPTSSTVWHRLGR